MSDIMVACLDEMLDGVPRSLLEIVLGRLTPAERVRRAGIHANYHGAHDATTLPFFVAER